MMITDIVDLNIFEEININIPFTTKIIDMCILLDKIKIHPYLLHIYPNMFTKEYTEEYEHILTNIYKIDSIPQIYDNLVDIITLYDYLNNKD